MVIGNESKYIEGFESFTIDDELMLSNLKQALQYTKDNKSINDESEDVTETPSTTRPKITKGKYKNPTTTQSSSMNPSEMNDSSGMNSSSIPKPSISPLPPIPSLKSIFNTGIPGVPTTTFPNSMNINNPRFIANSVNKNPTTTLASSSFKNIKNKFENVNQNEKDIEDEINNDNKKAHINPYMNESMQDIMDMRKKDRNNDDETDEEEDEEEDEMEDEEDNENYKNYKNKNNKNKIEGFRSKNNSRNNSIEGFNGSQIVEARYLKHILLALLISFIGYIICMSSINNYLPINEYAPHLKKFKNLIYVGIFFVITYMCLEIF